MPVTCNLVFEVVLHCKLICKLPDPKESKNSAWLHTDTHTGNRFLLRFALLTCSRSDAPELHMEGGPQYKSVASPVKISICCTLKTVCYDRPRATNLTVFSSLTSSDAHSTACGASTPLSVFHPCKPLLKTGIDEMPCISPSNLLRSTTL